MIQGVSPRRAYYSAAVEYESTHDELTGLLNYRAFSEFVENTRGNDIRGDLKLGVVDIDHFKWVNDRYGHLAGNELLKGFATYLLTSLQERFQQNVAVYRFGGEEFCIVFDGIEETKCTQAMQEIEKHLQNHPFVLDEGQRLTISFSCGIARSEETDPHRSLRAADEQLYRAKRQGRAQICTNFA
ncbi:GGDEF domain-containing protein [Limosilactobacillus kribbianus]|uniref:GGDEF domain-containing protein n=1 Tax=Limosilactobacillus kribbianus TaxID=2982695 RepID=UPI0022656429|nr:GGDEF domain-containing protein [Limosilactobacillus kribbianus]